MSIECHECHDKIYCMYQKIRGMRFFSFENRCSKIIPKFVTEIKIDIFGHDGMTLLALAEKARTIMADLLKFKTVSTFTRYCGPMMLLSQELYTFI